MGGSQKKRAPKETSTIFWGSTSFEKHPEGQFVLELGVKNMVGTCRSFELSFHLVKSPGKNNIFPVVMDSLQNQQGK